MRRLACLLFLSSVLSGCLAGLQTARTVPDNTYRFFAGTGVRTVVSPAKVHINTTNFFSNKTLDFGFRYGLSNSADLGIRFELPAFNFKSPTLLIDGKFEIVDTHGFVWSVTGGPLYSYASGASAGGHYLAFTGGFFFGYDFSRYFGSYLATLAQVPLILTGGGLTISLPGKVGYAVAPGFRIGDTWGFLAEATFFNTNGVNFLEVGGAFFIGDAHSTSDTFESNRRAERFKDRRSDRPDRSDRAEPRGDMMVHRTRPIRGTSRVLKVRQADNMALLSQPTSGNWSIGERVCLFRQNESVACGSITKSDYTGAVLKYATPSDPVTPGMDATSEMNDNRRRPKPSPEENAQPDPEATNPDLPELP